MKLKLEALRLAGLTNMEAGQFIRRNLEDLATIDQALLIDVPFNAYVQGITQQKGLYESALAQVRKNEETEKIDLADKDRDKSTDAFGRVLKMYAISDDPKEVEASRGLGIVFNNFKGLASMNYEAETLAIDKLVTELESPAHAAKIDKLKMGRYVARLKTTNEAFKTLFSNRMVGKASTESYDMKIIRADLMKKYTDFANYVQAMAKALETPLFLQSLSLMNTARKYYSDLLARRNGNNKEPEKPTD
jgi:hypothetical protein